MPNRTCSLVPSVLVPLSLQPSRVFRSAPFLGKIHMFIQTSFGLTCRRAPIGKSQTFVFLCFLCHLAGLSLFFKIHSTSHEIIKQKTLFERRENMCAYSYLSHITLSANVLLNKHYNTKRNIFIHSNRILSFVSPSFDCNVLLFILCVCPLFCT